MHHIKATFDKISRALNEVLGEQSPLFKKGVRPGPKHRFTDLDVIALSLASDYIGLKSENYLFEALNSDYKDSFPNLLSRRQYNDRRNSLKDIIAQLQELISDKMNKQRKSLHTYVVDSAPLRICKWARRNWSTVCKDDPTLVPRISKCEAQDELFYGFRVDMICNDDGVIKAYNVRTPNVDERVFLENVAHKFEGCRIVGDKGYIGQSRLKYLFDQYRVVVETPVRVNMKNQKPFIWGSVRKTIEKVFSQLNDQFRMQLNYAKSTNGYLTRINSKICAMTIAQFINQAKGRKLGKVQYALV